MICANHVITTIAMLFVLFTCSPKLEISLRPTGLTQEDAITIKNGNLMVTFTDIYIYIIYRLRFLIFLV